MGTAKGGFKECYDDDWILRRVRSSAQADSIAGRPVLGFDVGSDHFLIPTNGGDKVSARPEFVAEKSRHLAVSLRVLGRFLKETSSLHSRSCKTSCFRPAIGGGLAGLVRAEFSTRMNVPVAPGYE